MDEKQLLKINFIMLLSKGLHRYGASSDRIESALNLVSEKLNIEADFFLVPTGVFASFSSPNGEQHTRLNRLELGKINLEKLYLVDKTVDMVLDEKITINEGERRLKDIMNQSPRYSEILVTFSFMLIAATLTLFLNGTWKDCMWSSLFSIVVGHYSENVKIESMKTVFEAVIAFIVTSGSFIIYYLGFSINPTIVILASLIYLIPGLGLTTAIVELASDNLTSGTARLMGAIMVLLKISFGVFIATSIATYFKITLPPENFIEVSFLTKGIALIFTAIGLIIAFQARPQEGIWIIAMCFISFFSSQLLLIQVGNPISSFLAGSIVGGMSNVFAKSLNRPALIFYLPSILLLVPGSIGYQSLNFLFTDQYIEGIQTAFKTFAIAVALVSGIYFGNILIKPSRRL